MIQTLEKLAKILQSTVLKDSNIASIEIPESKRLAFAIEVPRPTMLDCWCLLRSLMDATQMYPILTDFFVDRTQNWHQDLVKADFFNRGDYLYEQQAGYFNNVSPESIINAAKGINGEEVIKSRIEQFDRIADEAWRESDWYLQDLEETQRNFTVSPNPQEAKTALNSGKIITEIDFERWLFNWQLDNVPQEQLLAIPDLTYLEWYDLSIRDTVPLLLLPTLNSWDTLAYIHFYGAINSAEAIAILKHWYDIYDAELVAHYDTMLHFFVRQKPQTLSEAFELACQHYEFAECTLILPGVSIREHARALLHIERWFLHERP